MNDLPITISSAPAKVASKQTSNSEAAQKDPKEFGNVLARQVADADKPNETSSSPTDANEDKNAADADKTKNSSAKKGKEALPADMLATLLAQPVQSTIPQTGVPPVANATLPGTDALQATGALTTKGEHPVLDLINGKMAAGKEKPGLEAVLPQAVNPVKTGKELSDKIKFGDLKEIKSSTTAQSLRAGAIGELATATLHPGMAPSSPAATTNATPMSINTPVTQAAWGDEFSQKITWMGTQRNQSAELHLNPPQLGPLDVSLKMNGDQATAVFTSPHAAVRDAIEQAIPRLREMMADSGIMLGNAMVSDQSAQKNQDQPSRKSSGKMADSNGITEVASTPESRISTIKRHQGMVDTFA